MSTRQEALDRLRTYRDRLAGCSSFEEFRDAQLQFISASIADMESDHEHECEVIGYLMDKMRKEHQSSWTAKDE